MLNKLMYMDLHNLLSNSSSLVGYHDHPWVDRGQFYYVSVIN